MKKGERIRYPKMNRMWRIASKEDLEIIDNAAYHILSEVGVHIDDKECIEYLKDAPVKIDEKELIVKFPEYWIREMIAKAPRSYVLAGRDPKWDLLVKSYQESYFNLFTSGSTKLYEWDDNTNQWNSRIPGEADVIRGFKMVDAIDAYDGFFGTPVEDVVKTNEGLPAELHTAYNKMKYSVKHGGPCAITEGAMVEWDYLGKLAAEVQGGFDELKKRPILASLPSCIGPLQSTRQNFWATVGGAKYYMPTYPYWGGTAPFTGPATGPAMVAMGVACTHYCIALSEYLAPGTPAIPWPNTLTTDPQSGQLAMTPFLNIGDGIGAQVYQDLYGLPVAGCAYCLTSALDEASASWALALITQLLWGVNVQQVGSTPQAFIFETIPMGETLVNYCKQHLFELTENFLNIDNEHLALDLIKEVGPKGMFTTKPHTLKWIDQKMGLFWRSNDWIHEHSDQWLAKGAKTWTEICRERLKELDKHEVTPPIDKDVDERCNALLKQADEELALF